MLGGAYTEVLRRAASVFARLKVRWTLIGGAALPARGRIRATRDFDVLVLAEGLERLQMIEALRTAGFAHHPRADFHRLERVDLYRFWLPVSHAASTGLDVQVSRDIYLDSVVQRATLLDITDDTRVPVAAIEDLVLMKLLSYRPIDRADAIELLQQSPAVDDALLDSWARSLDIHERLTEVLGESRADPPL